MLFSEPGRPKYWVLDKDHNAVPTYDIYVWGKFIFENGDRIVAQVTIGDKRVITVFHGLDHDFGSGSPLLFETMIFPKGSYAEEYCERCSTWAEAEAMHAKACAIVRGEAMPDE